jgi:hypothetical protein
MAPLLRSLTEREWSHSMRKGVRSMSVKQSAWADELTKFYEAALLELPSVAVRRLFAGDEQGFSEAGWKAYDSWVRLANEAANQLYANRAFGEAAGRAFETALGLQRLNDAFTSAFFGNLWPALGLPTASSVEALHDEAMALRQEHRALAAGGHLSKAAKVITPDHARGEDRLEAGREGIRPEEIRPSKKAA